MRRPAAVAALLAVISAVALLPACRKLLPANRYLQPRSGAAKSMSTADARAKFSHGVHEPIFTAKGLTCLDCHRFDAEIETGEEPLAREAALHALYPGGAACHYCHGPGDAKMFAAPGRCTTCHTNLTALRPRDHEVSWLKVHEGFARAQPASCENCHTQAQCIDCHERRDTIQTVVHDRNFRFFHSIEARANPMQCGSCHREDYCIRCHQEGKVEVQP